MKFPTNNKFTIKKLTTRTMQANRLRNTFVTLAIVLTAFLLTTIFSIGMSAVESLKLQQLRAMGTTAHLALTYPRDQQMQTVRTLDYIKAVGLQANVADILETPEMGNMVLTLHWYDKTEWEVFRKPTMSNFIGSYPEKANEIMIADWILKRMGINSPEIGMEIDLKYRVSLNNIVSEEKSQKFILSGYYTEYMNLRSDNIGAILVSEELLKREGKSPQVSGAASIMFTSGNTINSKLEKLAADAKLSSDQKLKVVPIYDNGSLADAGTLVAMVFIVFIIMLSGYLLIYNVLSLSVSKDIRYYGLLKTIGTTPVQLGRIVMGQALRLTAIGIPVGLLLGSFVSLFTVPMALSLLNYDSGNLGVNVSFNPVIYIGAVFFTLITTLIGSMKPARKAGNISPVEAVRYTGLTVKKNTSKSTSGGKVHRMAVKNIFRDRRRAMLVLASLFLGITTFLVINTVVLSMKVENLVSQYIKNDFKLTNNTTTFGSSVKQIFDSDFISRLKSLKSFNSIRKISMHEVNVEYSEEVYGEHMKDSVKRLKLPPHNQEDFLKNPDLFWTCLVGVDTEYIKELNEMLEIPIDTEAFDKGQIALFSSDKPELYRIGSDIAFLDNDTGKRTTTKLGGIIPSDTPYKGYRGIAPLIYISNTKMHKLFTDPIIYAVTLDAEDGTEKGLLAQLQKLTGEDKAITLDSRINMLEQFKSAKLVMFVLGGGMSLILAFIGIMNFINVMITGINVRRQEFAILESIGMTTAQIRKMLLLEGGTYAAITCIMVLLLGNFISYGIFTLFKTEATYAVYSFPFIALIISFLMIFAVCLTIPEITFKLISKQSVTERLRSIEG